MFSSIKLKYRNKVTYLLIAAILSVVFCLFVFYKTDKIYALNFIVDNNEFFHEINFYEELILTRDVLFILKDKIDDGDIRKTIRKKSGTVHNIRAVYRKRTGDLSITIENADRAALETAQRDFIEVINQEIKEALSLQTRIDRYLKNARQELALLRKRLVKMEGNRQAIENERKRYAGYGFEHTLLTNMAIQSDVFIEDTMQTIEDTQNMVIAYEDFPSYHLLVVDENSSPRIRTSSTVKYMNALVVLFFTFVSFVFAGLLFRKK
jgi:hypothetical protein